jgi:hypothetical protein
MDFGVIFLANGESHKDAAVAESNATPKTASPEHFIAVSMERGRRHDARMRYPPSPRACAVYSRAKKTPSWDARFRIAAMVILRRSHGNTARGAGTAPRLRCYWRSGQ